MLGLKGLGNALRVHRDRHLRSGRITFCCWARCTARNQARRSVIDCSDGETLMKADMQCSAGAAALAWPACALAALAQPGSKVRVGYVVR